MVCDIMLISIPVFVAALVVISKKELSIEKVQVLHQIGKRRENKKLFRPIRIKV